MTAVRLDHPALSRHLLRQQMARLINRLIDMLDDIDGDPDLEPAGEDEPSLSFPEPGIVIDGRFHVLGQDKLHAWLPNEADDREEEDEHDEASLCGVTFGAGDQRDLEEACEDEGAQCEDEGAVTGDDEPEVGA